MQNGTWRVALATRIGISVLAACMYGFAALLYSLPAIMRIPRETGDWMVVAVATFIAGVGIFATFALVAVVRMHVTIVAAELEATIVSGHNMFLVPRFRTVRMPVHDIRSVERRTEVYRVAGLSTMRNALSIVTSAGERIGLFCNSLGSADTLPLDAVADAIASAAGLAVTDDGTVRARGFGLYGQASSTWTETPLDAASARKAQRTVLLTVQITTALLLATLLLRACI